MCQESLVRYLYTVMNPQEEPVVRPPIIQDGLFSGAKPAQTVFTVPATREDISKSDLEAFIYSGEQAAHYETARKAGTVSYRPQLPPSIEENARIIDEKLRDIAVCDPAIGSGAFPVGMMTEIVRARMTLTPYFNDVHERSPYHFKRHAIQNCLYGADIDRGAVEIAKLRLWLSLVVDEEETKQIKPLPNLDFKIVSGNSLLGFPERYHPPNLAEIESLKAQFFEEPDHNRKATLKTRIDTKIQEVLAGSSKPLGYPVNFDFQLFFSEVFRSRNGQGAGFDIVIGNPPYVRADGSDEHMEARRQIQQTGLYETLWEKWDLYIPFIERGFKLLRRGGVITYIVSDAFCHAKYAQKSQDWFLLHARVLRLDFLSKIQIFEAAVRNITFFFQRADGACNIPERRVHAPVFGQVKLLPSDEQRKLNHRAFFPEDSKVGEFSNATILLGRICYITKGMVVNADEKVAKGAFTMDDLVSDTRDATHPCPFVEGKHLGSWLPVTRKWLEWGTARAPALFSRPTFPELYEVREKILVQRSPGPDPKACYDEHHLRYSESSVGFIPWGSLAGVRNKSLRKTARYKNEAGNVDLPSREDLETVSGRFAVKYLLAVMNSSAARAFLRANRRSNIHLYPDDWKRLPIPEASQSKQAAIMAIVDRILTALRSNPEADVSSLEAQVNRLVAALYGVREQTEATV
jgi:hypothetical protein